MLSILSLKGTKYYIRHLIGFLNTYDQATCMTSFLKRFIRLGVDRQQTQARHILFLNTISLLILILVFGNLPLTLREVAETPSGKALIVIIFLHAIMVPLTVVLNSLRLYKTARVYFCFMAVC